MCLDAGAVSGSLYLVSVQNLELFAIHRLPPNFVVLHSFCVKEKESAGWSDGWGYQVA